MSVLTIALFIATSGRSSTEVVQNSSMKLGQIKRQTIAPSVEQLTTEYRNTGLIFRHGVLSCADEEFAWYSIDEGSGGYLIHSFLYHIREGKPHLVLYVAPDANRISIVARSLNDRIHMIARTKQTPEAEITVAQYIVRHGQIRELD